MSDEAWIRPDGTAHFPGIVLGPTIKTSMRGCRREINSRGTVDYHEHGCGHIQPAD